MTTRSWNKLLKCSQSDSIKDTVSPWKGPPGVYKWERMEAGPLISAQASGPLWHEWLHDSSKNIRTSHFSVPLFPQKGKNWAQSCPTPIQFSPPWLFSSGMVRKGEAAPKKVEKREAAELSTERDPLVWVSVGCKRQPPRCWALLQEKLFWTKAKVGPKLDRPSLHLAPGYLRNADWEIREQSLCVRSTGRTAHYTRPFSHNLLTDRPHLRITNCPLGRTGGQYREFSLCLPIKITNIHKMVGIN